MYTSVERGAGVLAVQPVAITAPTRPDTRTCGRNSIEAVSPTGVPPAHLPLTAPPTTNDPEQPSPPSPETRAHSAHRLHPPSPNVDGPNGPMGDWRSGDAPEWNDRRTTKFGTRRSPGRSRGRRGHRRDRQPHHPVRRLPDPGGRQDGARPHLRDRQELRQGRPRASPRERRRPGEGHRHQRGRQDRPLDQGAAGPRAHAPAPRFRPGLRGPPEEVHAPERGAPGGLQALRRAQAQVGGSPRVGELRGSDLPILAEQLGRAPTVPFTVVARCPGGHPLVIRNVPVDERGDPFPTTFWLTCPDAVRAVSRLEAEGWISRLNERIEADPGFAQGGGPARGRTAPERTRGGPR